MECCAMQSEGWPKTLGVGLLIGVVASIFMTLAMMVLRYSLGVATPAELVGDRLAPTFTIQEFFELLARYGGYNELKQVGVTSVLAGQLAVGVLGGVLFAFIVRHRPTHRREPEGFSGSRHGILFIVVFVGVLWLTTLIALWPVLGTHYGGLPPGRARLATSLGLLISYAMYGLTLMWAHRTLMGPRAALATVPTVPLIGRRMALVGGLGAVAAILAGGLMRRLYDLATFSYDGLRYKGPDIRPITPNDRFYVVSKNVVDPRIQLSLWRLEVTGLVERPQAYRFEDLVAMPSVIQETTLECISNEIGDGLMSNALWKGVPMRRLLEPTAPRPGVREVLLHAADGYTDSIPLEKAMEPTTLVVYEMNGEPLPERHGYPARVIVPGLFGKNNVKWVTRIELAGADVKGFYEKQGWGPSFVVPTTSRFDEPAHGQTLHASEGTAVMLKGIAYAGARGVSGVEVSVDKAQTWHEAHIDYTGAPMAWVLWSYEWRPTQPGSSVLVVRATDSTGTLQTAMDRSFAPEGATGYHYITVRVEG
jgi:DMSO/TMAO reductase YedYZ molybdopterin-dependent catalytic subunit